MNDLNVYINQTKNISGRKYEEYTKKFKMESEIHPEIDFETHSGFLPFKLKLNEGFFKDKELLSGFEYYVSSFELETAKKEIDKIAKKRTSIGGFFRKKKNLKSYLNDFFVNEEIDNELIKCNNDILISFNNADSFEMRMALSFATFLVETCNGVLYDTESGTWYYSGGLYHSGNQSWNRNNIFDTMLGSINDYEKGFNESNIIFHEFKEWI